MTACNVLRVVGDYRITMRYHNYTIYDENDVKYVQPTCIIELQVLDAHIFRNKWVNVKTWYADRDDKEEIEFCKLQALDILYSLVSPFRIVDMEGKL